MVRLPPVADATPPAGGARSAAQYRPPQRIISTPFAFATPAAAGHACPCSGQCGTAGHATTTSDTNSGHSSVRGADVTADTDASLRSEPSTNGQHPKDDLKVLRNRRVLIASYTSCAAPSLRRSPLCGLTLPSKHTRARAPAQRAAEPARPLALGWDAHRTIGQRLGLVT